MKEQFSNKTLLYTLLLMIMISGCTGEDRNQPQEEEEEIDAVELPGAWYSMEEAQALAAENNKKVVVYAEAIWCPYCTQMKEEVFVDDEVQQIKEDYFYPVKVDIESDDTLTFRGRKMTERQFSQGMQVTATPTFIFFDETGEIIAAQPGFIPLDMYTQILEFVGTDAYLDQTFEEYADIDTTGTL